MNMDDNYPWQTHHGQEKDDKCSAVSAQSHVVS